MYSVCNNNNIIIKATKKEAPIYVHTLRDEGTRALICTYIFLVAMRTLHGTTLHPKEKDIYIYIYPTEY